MASLVGSEMFIRDINIGIGCIFFSKNHTIVNAIKVSTMSGGMAVALYTTLTGLVTSILLKFQYFILDSSLSNSLNYLSSKSFNET